MSQSAPNGLGVLNRVKPSLVTGVVWFDIVYFHSTHESDASPFGLRSRAIENRKSKNNAAVRHAPARPETFTRGAGGCVRQGGWKFLGWRIAYCFQPARETNRNHNHVQEPVGRVLSSRTWFDMWMDVFKE